MKKLLVLFILLVVSNCYGASLIGSGIVGATCTCDTGYLSCTPGFTYGTDFSNTARKGFKLTSGSGDAGKKICSVTFPVDEVYNSASQTITVRIGTSIDLSGESDAGSVEIDGDEVEENVEITLTTPYTLSASTAYYIGFATSNDIYADRIRIGLGAASGSGDCGQLVYLLGTGWDGLAENTTYECGSVVKVCD